MSIAMASSLEEQLRENPSMISDCNDKGWRLLHQEAAAGSSPTVKVLLKAGAETVAVSQLGLTPIQLARILGWKEVVALLAKS